MDEFAERKLLGRFQHRYGPNRVGPFGLLQPMAEIVKLAIKEQFRPRTATGGLFAIAPAISMIVRGRDARDHAVLEHGRHLRHPGRPLRHRPDIGILYAFAFGAIAFYGLMLGGWASGSKYSFLGAMRSAAQLISYEVSQGLALVGVIMMAGSLSLTEIVSAQDGHWFIIPQFVGFLIFLTPGFAETNRAPFDLAEADAELVGATRPSTAAGASPRYCAAEYLNMVVVSGSSTTIFLGGWLLPFGINPPTWVDPFVVLFKMLLLFLLHLGPRDAAAPALRPADELRLEGPPAPGDAQRPRDRDHRGGDSA